MLTLQVLYVMASLTDVTVVSICEFRVGVYGCGQWSPGRYVYIEYCSSDAFVLPPRNNTLAIPVASFQYCAERVLYEIASRRSADTVPEWRWDNVLNIPSVVRYLMRSLEGA